MLVGPECFRRVILEGLWLVIDLDELMKKIILGRNCRLWDQITQQKFPCLLDSILKVLMSARPVNEETAGWSFH